VSGTAAAVTSEQGLSAVEMCGEQTLSDCKHKELFVYVRQQCVVSVVIVVYNNNNYYY
jgi:hypothetical protein